MRRIFLVFISFVLVGGSLQAAAVQQGSGQAQWLVITAPQFRVVLEPLVERRQAEGLQATVIETTNLLSPEEIRQGDGRPLQAYIKRMAERTENRTSILLVGAVKASKVSTAEQTVVPSLLGETGRMKGQTSDYGYSLPNGEGMPTVAVGRFPGRTVEEVQGMVKKTLLMEQDHRPASWQNRIVLLQGNPGGGGLAEMFVEQATFPRLQRLHPFYSLQAMADSGASVFRLPASRLHETALEYLEGGQLFSIYLGHSDASGLWSGSSYFMSRDDWANLRIPRGQGMFFTCGCFACQWSGDKGEGYGLAAMRNATGPSAVIGATAESYSAPGLLAIDGFLRCCLNPPFPSRLADYWLAVQSGLARGQIDEGVFALYDQFDGSKGKVPLAAQRLEHLEMWMLLGDPALHLPIVPADIVFDPPAPVIPRKRITFAGTLPERLKDTTVRVTVERPVGSKPGDWEKLPEPSPENAAVREKITAENHRKANNPVLLMAHSRSTGNHFECPVELPSSLPWPKVVVRAYATNAQDSALGVVTLPVEDKE